MFKPRNLKEEFYATKSISKDNLQDGATYIGECRNAVEAVWYKDKNCFIYKRYKYGSSFDEDINHYEDDEGFDVFFPFEIKQ